MLRYKRSLLSYEVWRWGLVFGVWAPIIAQAFYQQVFELSPFWHSPVQCLPSSVFSSFLPPWCGFVCSHDVLQMTYFLISSSQFNTLPVTCQRHRNSNSPSHSVRSDGRSLARLLPPQSGPKLASIVRGGHTFPMQFRCPHRQARLEMASSCVVGGVKGDAWSL